MKISPKNDLNFSTHPNETNDDTQRHEQEVAKQKSDDPNHRQLPRDELVATIGAGEKVPVLQLLGFEARRHIVLDDRFHARHNVLEAVLDLKVELLISVGRIGIFLR